MSAVPLVRSRSLIETLWVVSGAPVARPVFPASSLFSLLASVSMAAQLNSARDALHAITPLLKHLRIAKTALNEPKWHRKEQRGKEVDIQV